MKIKSLVVLSFFVILTSQVFGQGTLKIGYTDVNFLLSQLPEYKQIESDLKAYEAQLQNQLKSKYKDAQDKYDALQKGGATMTEVVRQDKIKELENLQTSIQEFEKNASASFEQKRNTMIQPQFERIQKAIDDVAAENNFNFVFSANVEGLPIILSNPGEKDNISDLVLKKLGVTAVQNNTTPTNNQQNQQKNNTTNTQKKN
jgi:outer membrane protein